VRLRISALCAGAFLAIGCDQREADVAPAPKGAGASSGVVVLAHINHGAADTGSDAGALPPKDAGKAP
jgi:hypothetical protein